MTHEQKPETAENIISMLQQQENIKEKSLWLFIANSANKKWLYLTLVITVIYLILLRNFLPSPSFLSDSFTYIQAARDNSVISFRPFGYSAFLQCLHHLTTSDLAIVVTQYILNIIANLLLFFTCIYHFPLHRKLKWLLFVLLIGNPLYLIYSNYILSDALFCSITVLWFTLLILILKKPKWKYFIIQLLLLAFLFGLRYNAIVFPLYAAGALIFSTQSFWKKLIEILLVFFLIFILVKSITHKTEVETNVHVFSAFSGWQLANNAIHILRHLPEDTTELKGHNKEIYQYIRAYLQTNPSEKNNKEVTAQYMWNDNSPLKQYLRYRRKTDHQNSYLNVWTAMGPVYSNFGTKIILDHPFSYLEYFIWPNILNYFAPDMEAYGVYNENKNTVGAVAIEYFKYKSNQIKTNHADLYKVIIIPWKLIFTTLNLLFLLLFSLYLFTGAFNNNDKFFNLSLLLFSFFYTGNLIFVSSLAPITFRYSVFIVTLIMPFNIYLLQYLITFYSLRKVNGMSA